MFRFYFFFFFLFYTLTYVRREITELKEESDGSDEHVCNLAICNFVRALLKICDAGFNYFVEYMFVKSQ